MPPSRATTSRSSGSARGSTSCPAVHQLDPDLVVLDLQIGNMGGMAACMDIRLDESVDRLPHIPVLMLLDRDVDAFLANRSEADGWIVKPLDAFRLRRAATALLAGETHQEGMATTGRGRPHPADPGGRRASPRATVALRTHRGVAQLGRALRSGRRGRGFKSRHPDQPSNRSSCLRSFRRRSRRARTGRGRWRRRWSCRLRRRGWRRSGRP